MVDKTRKQLQEHNTNLKAGIVFFGILLIVLGALYGNSLRESKAQIEHKSLYESLEIIEENCGSTYITTCNYLSEDLCIFVRVERENGFSKYDYIPLRKCLK